MKNIMKFCIILACFIAIFASNGCGGGSKNKIVLPSVSIVNNSPDIIDTTNGDAIFDVVFSDEVTGFTLEDLSLSGGTASSLNGSGSDYTITITPEKNSIDPIVVSIPSDVAENMSGEGNTSSNMLTQAVNTQLPFITRWRTDSRGVTNDRQIKISTFGDGYDYKVDWGDGIVEEHIRGDKVHTYQHSGDYEVKITGDFPRIFFSTGGGFDNEKLLSVKQWGTIEWESMNSAFFNCYKLTVLAVDIPDLSKVTDMSLMFLGNYMFNQDISRWDTSNIKDMSLMFYKASSFNQDLSTWNTGNVKTMKSMFQGASVFNQNLDSWNVSNVVDMSSMFEDASDFNSSVANWNIGNLENMSSIFKNAAKFNQAIGNWNTSNVKNMEEAFRYALNFNQNIGSWDTSNVINMHAMFSDAKKFNQDISNWNTTLVQFMHLMFNNATSFDQNISNWDVSNVSKMTNMFKGLSFSAELFNAYSANWPLFESTGALNRDQ